jgi:hypothetical protein
MLTVAVDKTLSGWTMADMRRRANNRSALTLVVLLSALAACASAAAACARKPVNAVIVVSQEGIRVSGGHVPFVKDGGRMRPDIWSPGNVVIYRTDATTGGGEQARTGRAYRINDNYKLDDLGAIDLTKTDEQLAGQFGVTPAGK